MRADDAYRAELHRLIDDLRDFAAGLEDVATVDIGEDELHWRLRLVPGEPAACPVEIILHSGQRYDIAVGSETYESLALQDLTGIKPLLVAIAEGNVITRTWTTLATGSHHSTATHIEIPTGPWVQEHVVPGIARVADRDVCAVTDRHYAPYRSARAPVA